MISLSNGLSFLRAPLAFLFLQENVSLRVMAVLLAMISDSVDGYFARKSKSVSKFGAILDPTMDKFFVYFALLVLFLEGNIHVWQALTLVARDFFLFLFSLYLLCSKQWKTYEFHAIRWGKVTTALQFIVLIGLTFHFQIPSFIYCLFVIFGVLAFWELFRTAKTPSSLS